MEKHNNVKGKLIGGILAVVLPFLIIQGVIYELLQYGVIKTGNCICIKCNCCGNRIFYYIQHFKSFTASVSGCHHRRNNPKKLGGC